MQLALYGVAHWICLKRRFQFRNHDAGYAQMQLIKLPMKNLTFASPGNPAWAALGFKYLNIFQLEDGRSYLIGCPKNEQTATLITLKHLGRILEKLQK